MSLAAHLVVHLTAAAVAAIAIAGVPSHDKSCRGGSGVRIASRGGSGVGEVPHSSHANSPVFHARTRRLLYPSGDGLPHGAEEIDVAHVVAWLAMQSLVALAAEREERRRREVNEELLEPRSIPESEHAPASATRPRRTGSVHSILGLTNHVREEIPSKRNL